MRRRFLATSPVLFLLLASLSPAVCAEVTRTLRVEVPADSGRFGIDNLAGTMRVVAGSGPKVVAVATIHAESEELASAMRFERVSGGNGEDTYRVRYPIDRAGTIRYPGMGGSHSGFWGLIGGSSTNTKYDGRMVKVSGSSGTLLYADVEVQVPHAEVRGSFRNLVGRIDGNDLAGQLSFETGSGRVTLARLDGKVTAEAGSGDIEANEVTGSFSCETGSGDCTVHGFHGDVLKAEAGSGTLRIESPHAAKVDAETGSGDVHVIDADIEEFDGETGSGDIELAVRGSRLMKLAAETGSGDVTLKLPRDAAFEAVADQGSGDITSRFADASPILKDKTLVGYRRGDGHTHIAVSTGSGDLLLAPAD